MKSLIRTHHGTFLGRRNGALVHLKYEDAGPGELYVRTFSEVLGWFRLPNCYTFEFETLVGERGASAQRAVFAKLIDLMGAESCRLDEVIERTICAQTLTYSGGSEGLDNYWSEHAEQIFDRLDGPTLSRCLGY